MTSLGDQHAALSRLIAPLDEPDWKRPTRCTGWTVADVVLHMAQTDELAIASLRDRLAQSANELVGDAQPGLPVDAVADLAVARQRGAPGAAVGARWQASADELRALLAATDPHRRVRWVAGELSAQTLATTRLAECWIHTDDVAEALGTTVPPSPRLVHIARLAWRTLPYAFARAERSLSGPVAFELRGPSGDAWDFHPDSPARTTIRGDATELCNVAARRIEPSRTHLTGDGPDTQLVLQLVRTYA